jgi:hypothetical protein
MEENAGDGGETLESKGAPDADANAVAGDGRRKVRAG